MTAEEIRQIDALIRREVVPATGCTEPVCVALAVAYASSLISNQIQSIEVQLSPNMLKNAMGVGIPGTGMIGVPIAIALGAEIKEPKRGLEILDNLSEEILQAAKALVDKGIITVACTTESNIDKLYVRVCITDTEGHQSISVIDKTHQGISLLTLDGISYLETYKNETVCSAQIESNGGAVEQDIQLTFDLVYDYATTAPLELLTFIYEAAQQNKTVSEYSLSRKYGHGVGKLLQSPQGQYFIGNSPMAKMLMYTSGACDARMDGAPLMVMSNSGSGNQGITATLPILSFAEAEGKGLEETTRALMMSSLMVVYIKQLLGRLSCLCGMVVSGIGTSAALVYLLGGNKLQSSYAIQNMVGNVTGMICDGAKPSCSLKASTGVSSAMISALLAMEDERCSSLEGIVANDVDQSISNLALIGRDGMAETDLRILNVMTNK